MVRSAHISEEASSELGEACGQVHRPIIGERFNQGGNGSSDGERICPLSEARWQPANMSVCRPNY